MSAVTTLAQTVVTTMREMATTPDASRPNYLLVNTKDLEAVIEEHLDEYLARDHEETPPPSTHVVGLVERLEQQNRLLIGAAEASEQCITDFLEIYERGGSMTVLDLAVRSLKNDARKLVRAALATTEGSDNG